MTSSGPSEGAERGVGAGAGEPGRVDRRVVHEGRIVHLSVDRVRFPDGSVGELELVEHAGAAAVVPLLGPEGAEDPEILLVRQYRYAAGGYLYEVPAGMRERDDTSWEDCARRELEEETGYTAGVLRPLTRIYTTPGFTDEVIHLFLARDLAPGETRRDRDEFMEVVPVRFSRVLDMIRNSEIVDAKSVSAILYARSFAAGVRLPLPGT